MYGYSNVINIHIILVKQSVSVYIRYHNKTKYRDYFKIDEMMTRIFEILLLKPIFYMHMHIFYDENV